MSSRWVCGPEARRKAGHPISVAYPLILYAFVVGLADAFSPPSGLYSPCKTIGGIKSSDNHCLGNVIRHHRCWQRRKPYLVDRSILARHSAADSLASPDAGATDRRQEVNQFLDSLFGENSSFWERRQYALKKSSTKNSLAIDTGELTYGEFDMDFFCELLEKADLRQDTVFCDVGSGCGRLVLAAALMYPDCLKISRGVEIFSELHEVGLEALEQCSKTRDVGTVQLESADVHKRKDLLRDVDICFCYSTTWTSTGPYLTQLSMTFGLGLRPGSRIITVDKLLASDGPWEFELLDSIQGRNKEVGGSVGHIWKVVKSPLEA